MTSGSASGGTVLRGLRGRRVARRAPLLLVMLGLQLLGVAWLTPACSRSPELRGTVISPPLAAPELEGMNWDGKRFVLSEREEKLAVVFFGYASCPDICPATLSRMKRVRQSLGPLAKELAVVLVSVDPARDSLELLAGYVPAFDDAFYGLRIPEERVEAVSRSFAVGYRVNEPDERGYYTIDHTGYLFVVDRRGQMPLRFSQSNTVEEISADLRALLGG